MVTKPWLPGLLAALAAGAAPAQDLRGILPDECVTVVEVPDPVAALTALRGAIGHLPADLPPEVQALAGAGLLFLRSRIGGSIEDFVADVAAGGLAFGLVPGRPGSLPLLVLRPGSPERAAEHLANLGQRVHGERCGDLMLVSTTAAGCARLRAGVGRADPGYATGTAPGTAPDADSRDRALVRARVDLESLWRHESAPDVEALDAGGRFVASPIGTVLARARRLDARLDAAETVRLTIQLDASVHGTRWAGLLAAGTDGRDVAPMPAGGILQVAIDRSLAALLRRPGTFLSEGGQLDVESFLSIADLFDGAATSFVDDLVGGLREPMVLSVLEAELPDEERCPVLVPGVALSAAIAEPGVEKILRNAAGLLTTIVNTERAQNGRKPFVLRTARSAHGKGLGAEPPLWRGPGLPPIEDSLSPTLLFGHGHVVLATTHAAADAVLAALAGSEARERVRGDRLVLRGGSAARALAASRSPLELGRILDEAETEDEAARFFDVLIAVAAAIGRAELRADYGEDATTVTLELERAR